MRKDVPEPEKFRQAGNVGCLLTFGAKSATIEHSESKGDNMLKRTVCIGALLLALICALSSCRVLDSLIGLVRKTEEETETQLPWDDSLPAWSAEETYSAAMAVLEDPTGGIVDISAAKYSYGALCDDLEALARAYPARFSYRSIGTTAAGREIWLGVLGNPEAPRQVVVSAAIHAREYLTALLTMRQVEFYLANYGTGSYEGTPYYRLFEETCFYILPMTNPDGVMLAQEGLDSLPNDEMKDFVRGIFETEGKENGYKTLSVFLSHWKANARGVDLNRNYDALWENYAKGPDRPESHQYKGPSPASEAETQALTGLISSLSNPVAVLCMHSQGEVVYWNCGQSGDIRQQTRLYAERIGDRTGYRVVNEQNNDASLSDWAVLKKGIVSITVETGKGSYPMPISQFPQMWEQNYDLLPLTAAWFAKGAGT